VEAMAKNACCNKIAQDCPLEKLAKRECYPLVFQNFPIIIALSNLSSLFTIHYCFFIRLLALQYYDYESLLKHSKG